MHIQIVFLVSKCFPRRWLFGPALLCGTLAAVLGRNSTAVQKPNIENYFVLEAQGTKPNQ
jgi:hypothetical protein